MPNKGRTPFGSSKFHIYGIDEWEQENDLKRLRDMGVFGVERPLSGDQIHPRELDRIIPFDIFLERRKRAAGLPYRKEIAGRQIHR